MLPTRTDRLVIFGVLNVTPDSFSDGGKYGGLDDAVAHGIAMANDGADVVDVGGESTRPGAVRVPPEVEIARAVPVVRALAASGVRVSIDTYRAAVAEAALEAGASIVNDVSGGLGDSDMGRVVREADCPWILMHWRGHSASMQNLAVYDDVVREVSSELRDRVTAAMAAGVDPSKLVIDPGLGFAKTAEHNWKLLASLYQLQAMGIPVLLGASRKSFLGTLLADAGGTPRTVDDREAATVAITAMCAAAGIWGVRVHDVRPNVDAARTVAAVQSRLPHEHE